MSLRSSGDVETELARVMTAPPTVEIAKVADWIAKLQSLSAEIRRAQKRESRTEERFE